MKKNKAIAGYHLLMILSAVDGKFSVQEDLIIERWLEKEFPLRVNLDRETEFLSKLKPDDYMIHFQSCMTEQCAKPAFAQHPTCIERRAMEERRRETERSR